MKRKRRVWITRDLPDHHTQADYEVWVTKPKWNPRAPGWFVCGAKGQSVVGGAEPGSMCAQSFEFATGWHMPGGPDSIFELEFSG